MQARPSRDFSAFGDADFDKKEWVNTVLRGLTRDESTDAYIANLAMKLQLLSQDLSVSTQTCMAQVALSMPRTVREIRHIGEQSRALRGEITVITRMLDDMAVADQLGRLQELDATHDNMTVCAERLQQAARWGQQIREVEGALAQCERAATVDAMATIARQLGALTASFDALSGMPGTPKRQKTLDRNMDRFESVVLPELVERLSARSAEGAAAAVRAARPFVDIFLRVGRLRNLELQYAQSRQMRVAKLWRDYSDGDDFTAWLASFYDDVLAVIGEEIKEAAALFAPAIVEDTHAEGAPAGAGAAAASETPSPDAGAAAAAEAAAEAAAARSAAVGCNLLFSMLAPLDREFTKRLEGRLLPEIAELIAISSSFAQSILTHVPVHERDELLLVIGRPYASFASSYAALERTQLSAQLLAGHVVEHDAAALGEAHDGPLDLLSAVGEAIPMLFFELDAATGRCLALTAGSGARGLLGAVTRALESFAEHVERVVLRVRAIGGVPAHGAAAMATADTATATATEEGEEGTDVFSDFDWALVQAAFVVMQSAFTLRTQALALDANFATTLSDPSGALCTLLRALGGEARGTTATLDFAQCLARKALQRDAAAVDALRALIAESAAVAADSFDAKRVRGDFRMFVEVGVHCDRVFEQVCFIYRYILNEFY